MNGQTAYLCPVCGEELVRVLDPEAPTDLVLERKPLGTPPPSIHEAIHQIVTETMRRHYAEVDTSLRDAVERHECAHPLRWRWWKRRHREELVAAR